MCQRRRRVAPNAIITIATTFSIAKSVAVVATIIKTIVTADKQHPGRTIIIVITTPAIVPIFDPKYHIPSHLAL